MRLSTNIERLQPSATIAVSSLAKKLRAEGRDIIDLSAGEPDFDTPGFIAEAGVRGIQEGNTRYTPTPGMPALRKAIAEGLSRRSGSREDWQGVVVSTGAKQSLFNACFSLFGPGDEVLIAAPYWTSYPQMVVLSRAEPVPVFGAEERDFRLTPGDLDRVVTERTRGLILCSPSNPTGTVYSASELDDVARWLRDRELVLISDEIYRNIYFGDEGGSAPGVLEVAEDARGPFVLIDGVSKSFAMTGWRIGFGYTEPELAARMGALQSHITSNASAPAQVAALAAYQDPTRAGQAVGDMVESFRRRRDLVVGLVRELLPSCGFVEPRGAFYLFFRVDSAFTDGVTGSVDLCAKILDEVGVALVPGVAFGDDRFVRMSFATSDQLLEDGIRRIATVLG